MYNESFGLIQVLGIPWDVDTDGLQDYRGKFGDLDDVIVMQVSLNSCNILNFELNYIGHESHFI